MATVSRAVPTAERLTLSDILSDLESLNVNSSLFPVASSSKVTDSSLVSTGAGPSDLTLLDTITSSSKPISSMSDYVLLSRQLRASFVEAQRLNSEPIAMEQVALLLPSERGKLWARSVTNAPKATRTDLLHAKVATLQTQVDDWSEALRAALNKVNTSASTPTPSLPEPSTVSDTSVGQAKILTPEAEPEQAKGQDATVQNPRESSSEPISESAAEFEDDDPWNDLS